MSMGPVDPRQPDDFHSASTDSDLMNAAKRMDPLAWGNLVDRYSKLLFQWCRSSGLDADNSADVVQAVLAQAALPSRLQEGREARRVSPLAPYLGPLEDCRLPPGVRESTAGGGSGGAGDHCGIAVRRPGPRLWARIRLELPVPDPAVGRFWQLVERLEDQFEASTWQAFWLTTVESRTSKEVADLLKMTPNSVRLAKARVLRKLRAEAAKPQNGNSLPDD